MIRTSSGNRNVQIAAQKKNNRMSSNGCFSGRMNECLFESTVSKTHAKHSGYSKYLSDPGAGIISLFCSVKQADQEALTPYRIRFFEDKPLKVEMPEIKKRPFLIGYG